MDQELKKRIIIEKTRDKINDLGIFTETMLYEHDFSDHGISFNELGMLLIEIEKESGGHILLLDVTQKEQRKLSDDEIAAMVNFYGGPEGLSEYAERPYYMVQYKSSYEDFKKKKLSEFNELHKKKTEVEGEIDSKSFSNKPIREPISVKIIGDIGIRGFEEKIVLAKPKNKRIQLRKFPADLRWGEISIRFLNEHEVIIKARNETFQTTFDAIGCQDDKTKLPNKQWMLLRLLAVRNGEFSWENNSNLLLKDINKVKKQKQLLSEALKAFFQMSDDPFYNYKTEKAYRIKLALTPESELKSVDEREVIGDEDDLGIKESLKKQAPVVYEE